MNYCYMESPAGKLLIMGENAGVRWMRFLKNHEPFMPEPDLHENPAAFQAVTDQLAAYFDGRLKQFDLLIDLQVSPFQKKVLTELRKVPYGETISYGGLAARIGQPGAARVVGMANARNPLPIIIPCHRVIGSKGNLVGYGGGLDIKQMLLDLEQKYA